MISRYLRFLYGKILDVKLPENLRVLLKILAIPLIIICVLYFSFLEYVKPNEFGIKEVQIGANKGIQKKVYGPGLAIVIPFMQRMHTLPQYVQVLEMKRDVEGKRQTAAKQSRSVYHDKPVKIQTSDGFFVVVYASILYRIVDPYKVVTVLGPGSHYLHQGILPMAEPILKQALGELTTEEFYNSPLRVEKADRARDLLNKELMPKGLHVDQVLVRYFEYTKSIQDNIESKKLQDQLVFTNQSKRRSAQEEQNLNRVKKEGQMKVIITMQEGDAYRIRKEAQRDLYVRRRSAEADLLVELARAESEEQRNDAMQVLGANRMVAMSMAGVLKGLDVIVLPSGRADDLNPLDLDSVLEIFGGGDRFPAQTAVEAKAGDEIETEVSR